MTSEHQEEFLAAMEKEMQELDKMKMWKVRTRKSIETELKKKIHVVPSQWCFKIKRYPDGRFKKFKARMVVRGDRMIEGVDYDEKYAPVVAWSTVRMVMVLAAQQKWASM